MVNIINRGFDVVMRPLAAVMSPWSLLILFALASSVLVLLIFRWTSTPEVIRHYKNMTTARLLEFLLYRNDPVVSLGAFPRLLAANGHYIKALLQPMLFSLIPMLFVIVQLSRWLDVQPLHPGDTALVKVALKSGVSVLDHDAVLHGTECVKVDSPAIRIPAANEIVWKVRGVNPGKMPLTIVCNGKTISKDVVVTRHAMAPVSSQRMSMGVWNWLSVSGEKMIPGDVPIRSIQIYYPEHIYRIGMCPLHWLVVFFVLTLVFAWLLKRFVGVEV